jgi:hypothetical protein
MSQDKFFILGAIILVVICLCCPYLIWLLPALVILENTVLAFKEAKESKLPTHTSIDEEIDTDKALFMYMKTRYLASKEWQNKRKTALARDNYTCQRCGVTGVPLHVHHKSGYNLIPNEPLSCLVTLCEACHTAVHTEFGYPKTYQEYMNWDYPIKSTKNVHLNALNI